MAKIMIVEDEASINDLIKMNLMLVGHECFQVYDGREVVSALAEFDADLVLLDVMLPHKDGFTLMEENLFGDIPVIFLTAKDSTGDKVKGLKLGADDYISKPFEAVELLARVEAVLRRTKTSEHTFLIGETHVDFDTRRVTMKGEPVELTKQEFELLEVFVRNRNLALSREKLLDLAWGYDYYGDMRTVDVHVAQLRKKLKLENYIKTVFKIGYRLEV